ncbi:MAG: ATP-binding protein [Coleofasciculaceae cyanobacterium]
MLKEQGQEVQKPISTSQDLLITKSSTQKQDSLASPEQLQNNIAWLKANQFFKFAPDLIGFMSLDGEFQLVNPAFETILSYTATDIISRNFLDFVHPEDQISTLVEWKKLSADLDVTNITCENRYRCRDGSYKYLAWSIFGGVEAGSFYAIARLIPTPQLNPTLAARSHSSTLEINVGTALVAEHFLNRREALLFGLANQIRNSLDLNTILDTAVQEIRQLLNINGCHFLWCWLEDGKQASFMVTHEACNPGAKSLLGEYSAQYLSGLAQQIRKLEALRIDDISTAKLDTEIQAFLGHEINSGLLLPLKTKTGQLGAIVCSHYQVRVWSDQEVELLQGVVDQLAIAIEHAELFAKTRATALAAQTQARQLEFALKDLQQTESHLLQSEKMASLGQMVAGIAHEINNPVSFITGNLSHANTYIQDLLKLVNYYQKYYPNPQPILQEYLEEIDLEFLLEDLPKILASMQMGADRIHEIVLSLRNFSRVDQAQMKPVNIHEGLDNTILILHNRLKPSGNNPGIMVVKEYGNLPLVECYYGQLNQVFMNIISNAIDSLENHCEPTRTITIATSVYQENLKQNCSQNHSNLANSVIIRISDNGGGMTPTVINQLFDPFFTTKSVGKGTGLGLSISHQIIVEKHSGILKCSSEPGKGSEFWIQIPITPPVEVC